MRGHPRCSVLAAVAFALISPIVVGEVSFAAERTTYLGRPLIEVLRQLQERGLRVIFSSAVVDERTLVTLEPRTIEPRAILEEILAPLGLEARDGPAGSILIVRASAEGRTGSLRGRVLSLTRGAPVAGASVRVLGAELMTSTRRDGTFEISRIPPGACDVIIEATGFVPRTLSSVRLRPGDTRGLSVKLEALPMYLEEITVVPSRLSVVQQEQNPDLSVSDDESVLVPTFGGDVSRIIELLPGVAASDNSAAFHVRGSRVGDVAFVLDGLEIYDPFHLLGFQSPFSILDAEIIERIDFVSGAFTADLGDRHGGVVKVDSWVPETPHSTRIGIGTLNSRISHGGPTPGGAASWLVSARTWYPESLRDTIELGESGLDPRFGDAYFRYSFNVSPRTALSAHALVAYDELEFKESGGGETVDTSSEHGYVWLRALRTSSGGAISESVLSAGRLDRSRQGISQPENDLIEVIDDRVVNVFGIRHDLTWGISDSHLVKAGVEARRLDAEYRYTRDLVGSASPQTSIRLAPSGTSLGGYASYRAGITANVATEVGLRWDRQAYTEEEQVSPRFNAIFRFSQTSELRFGMGYFHQSQRIHELDIEDGETRFSPAELSRQASLTFQHGFPGDVLFRFDAYYRSLSRLQPRHENLFNPIELYPETEADRASVSAQQARLRGIEISVRRPPVGSFNWWVSYAWSSAEDFVDGGEFPRSWDQPHTAKFLLGYRASDRWFVSLSGTGHTGWPTTPISATAQTHPAGTIQIEQVVGPRNSDRFPVYYRFDLKTSRSFTVAKGELRLDLEVLNLTDRDNTCCVDEFVFRPRLNGSVDVEREDAYWLGLTPSFKLLYSF